MISEEVKQSTKKSKLQPQPQDMEELDDLSKPRKKTSSKKSSDKENAREETNLVDNSLTPNKQVDKSKSKSAVKRNGTTKSKPRSRVRTDLKNKPTPLKCEIVSKDVLPTEKENEDNQTNKLEGLDKNADDELKVTEQSVHSKTRLREETTQEVIEKVFNDLPLENPQGGTESELQELNAEEESKLELEGRPILERSIQQEGQEHPKEEDLHQGQQEHREDEKGSKNPIQNSGEGEKGLEPVLETNSQRKSKEMLLTGIAAETADKENGEVTPSQAQDQDQENVNQGKFYFNSLA
jgi:hypothetical protein